MGHLHERGAENPWVSCKSSAFGSMDLAGSQTLRSQMAAGDANQPSISPCTWVSFKISRNKVQPSDWSWLNYSLLSFVYPFLVYFGCHSKAFTMAFTIMAQASTFQAATQWQKGMVRVHDNVRQDQCRRLGEEIRREDMTHRA